MANSQNMGDRKVGMLSVEDAMAVALAKKVTEEGLRLVPQVGNGNFRSAFVKGVGALGLGTVKNRYVRYGATGMGIDAFDDFFTSVKRVVKQRQGSSQGLAQGSGSNSSGGTTLRPVY